MMVEQWSKDIRLVELPDNPMLGEEIAAVMETAEAKPTHVVLNFSSVSFVNSSDLSKLLRLRKAVTAAGRRLVLCAVSTQVWGVFMVTGLDKVFEFTNDVATALAGLQLTGAGRHK